MSSTPLHRALGRRPGPLDESFLKEAVEQRLPETRDLDWKSQLPLPEDVKQSDILKDVAAMANSGGGMIVFGVSEKNKHAKKRTAANKDHQTGKEFALDESYQRRMRQAIFNSIHPGVFGVKIERIEGDPLGAAVIVPPSSETPHMVRGEDGFRVPVRFQDDTHDVNEREIEAMYRRRFEERSRMTQDLDALYEEAHQSCETSQRAWLIAVARPRIPYVGSAPDRGRAERTFDQARELTLVLSSLEGDHLLQHVQGRVDPLNARPGMRRWSALNQNPADRDSPRGAFASLHHDGSVTVGAAVGGGRTSFEELSGEKVLSFKAEAVIADFMAMVRRHAEVLGLDEYDVRVGIEWSGEERLQILGMDGRTQSLVEQPHMPLRQFTPVRASINAAALNAQFQQSVIDIGQDCINQGGLTVLKVIKPAATEKSHDAAYVDEANYLTQNRLDGHPGDFSRQAWPD